MLKEEKDKIEKDLAFIKTSDLKSYEDIKFFIKNARKLKENNPAAFKRIVEVLKIAVEKGIKKYEWRN